jgi:cell division protein FtsW (lipid II flippase)
LEIKFKYVRFIGRLLDLGKPLTFMFFFAMFFVAAIHQALIIAIGVSIFFYLVVMISLFYSNIYFIQELSIKDGNIFLRVYKYDKIVIERTYKLSEVNIDVVLVRAGVRGKSYKLRVQTKDIEISQYQRCGWNKEEFDAVLSACRI